jgi:hypothetical protein
VRRGAGIPARPAGSPVEPRAGGSLPDRASGPRLELGHERLGTMTARPVSSPRSSCR